MFANNKVPQSLIDSVTKVIGEQVDESTNPFDPNYKSQIPTKPGEKAGFDSKKVSTGTVYTKKVKKEEMTFKDRLIEGLKDEEISEEEELELDNMLNEVLSKDASAGDWIHDFVHSANPKFKGKSSAQRKKMALAAYYAKQNEEVEIAEAVNEKQIKKDLDSGMSTDAVIGKHANKALTNTNEIRKVIQQHAWNKRMNKEEDEQIHEVSLELAKRARDKAEHLVDMDYDDLRDRPYGYSEKQRVKFQKYVDKKEPKKDVKEEVEIAEDVDSAETTTDMLRGREAGGKSNTFKSFKVKMKGDGVTRPAADDESKVGTTARSSVVAGGADAVTIPPQGIVRKEEVETLEEGPFSSGSLKPTQKMIDMMKKNDEKTEKHTTFVGKDSKGKYTSKSVNGKEISRKYHSDEGKDPNIDPGVGAAPNFATSQGTTPVERIKYTAKKSLSRLKSEMLGKAPGNN